MIKRTTILYFLPLLGARFPRRSGIQNVRNERFLGEGHALPYDVVRVMMVVVLRVLRLRVSRIAAHNIDAMVIGIGEVVVTIAIAEHIYKANGMEFAGVDVKGDNHGGVHDNVEQNACPNEIDLLLASVLGEGGEWH